MKFSKQLGSLLIDCGFSEAEVRVYRELLRNPAATIWDLVKRTGLSKSTTYRAFDRLHSLRAVENSEQGIQARSLKYVVAELQKQERSLRKNIVKLKQLAPYLHAAGSEHDTFEDCYTPDQIRDAYLHMSQVEYDTNLDFGDFENFVPIIGGLDAPETFRRNRLKHAQHRAVCTTFGPFTSHFCTRKEEEKFRSHIDLLDLDFMKHFIVFSDTGDSVLYAHFSDEEHPYAVLAHSHVIAEAERARFRHFSQKAGNA
ncbi:MAG: helix-turn-helix domain-containing protein [Candidatus Peribacteraceae bacterium]|jgi:predicted transcriptional regulator|nr:helix-turn-helix domain-containing protein [Candidatus Peribacteraceae bacterium]